MRAFGIFIWKLAAVLAGSSAILASFVGIFQLDPNVPLYDVWDGVLFCAWGFACGTWLMLKGFKGVI